MYIFVHVEDSCVGIRCGVGFRLYEIVSSRGMRDVNVFFFFWNKVGYVTETSCKVIGAVSKAASYAIDFGAAVTTVPKRARMAERVRLTFILLG